MEDKMLERIARQLESVEARYEELTVQITLPEVINDACLLYTSPSPRD